MKYPIRRVRRARLAAQTLAVTAALTGMAGILAGEGSAAPTHTTGKGAHLRRADDVKRPKLRHGELTVEGTDGKDGIALRLRAGDPDTIEVQVDSDGAHEFSFDRRRVTSIAVYARAGDDHVEIDDANGAFTDTIPTTIDAGDGNDTIAGGTGAETLVGGSGNDSIDGNGGNDRAFLGSGDDTFVWDPGDGSDTVEGEDGLDTMLFNGADVPDRVDLVPNGNRLTFLRDPGRITMDTAGVERVDFNARGGADVVTVGDLRKTDVSAVNLDLGAGDGAVDRVVVDGTNGDDRIDVGGDASGVTVAGAGALVSVHHQEPTDDLVVDGLGGDDVISATGLAAGAITPTLEGGIGDDTLAGGKGVDTLRGDDGNDSIDGNGGNDVAFMGTGDDTFVWDPGDGSDTVEGENGLDTMLFKGADGTDQVDLSANGNRLRFFRTQGTVTMDTAGIERVDFDALGGADTVTVHDLRATDVRSFEADLGGSDNQADRVVVDGTNGDDAITVSGDSRDVKVAGLAATTEVLGSEAAKDRLEIDTLDGRDSVDSRGLAVGAIQLFVDTALVP